MDPLQWMGAVRMNIDKNIPIIHNPVHQSVLWGENYVYPLLVDYYDIFICCLDARSDGTHSNFSTTKSFAKVTNLSTS